MTGIDSSSFDKHFTFHWFDIMPVALEDRALTYEERLAAMRTHMDAMAEALSKEDQVTITPLYPEIAENEAELLALEEKYLAQGLEGAMLRRMDGPYHMGRATLKSGILSKLKRFSDAEATVIGFEELMRNENVAEKNAFGRTKRGQGKDGLVPAGTLGSLIVRREEDGLTFNIGSGFSSADRAEIWANQDAYLGKLVTYRSFLMGVKVLPRFPTYVGLRLDL